MVLKDFWYRKHLFNYEAFRRGPNGCIYAKCTAVEHFGSLGESDKNLLTFLYKTRNVLRICNLHLLLSLFKGLNKDAAYRFLVQITFIQFWF